MTRYIDDDQLASNCRLVPLAAPPPGASVLPCLFSAPLSATPPHPLDRLAWPVMLGPYPNITGETGGLVGYNELASGCFKRTNTGTATLPPGNLVTHADLNFSAQLSNPIYNGGTTVQPSSLQSLACIKV